MSALPGPDFQVDDLLGVLRKRWWAIALTFAVVVTSVMIWTLRQPRIYKATARLEISNERPRVVQFKDVVPSGPESYWGTLYYLQTQYHNMRSPTVAQRAIDNMTEAGTLGADLKDNPNAAAGLRSMIAIAPIKDSMLVDLSVTHTDPTLAARYANEGAKAYRQENLDRHFRATQEAVDWLSEQLEIYKTKKREAEAAVLGFKREHNIVSLEERHNLVLKALTSRTDAFERISSQRISLASEHKKLKQLARGGIQNKKALVELFSGTEVATLDNEMDRIEQDIAAQSRTYKPKHPKMVALYAQRDAVKIRIDEEVGRVIDAKGAKISLLTAQEETLGKEVQKAKSEALDLEQKISSFKDLMAEAETSQKFYEALDTRMNEADLTSVIRYNNIRVVDQAGVPGGPISPHAGINFLIALAAGLFGGIGLAFLLEYLDRSVKTIEDVEKTLRLPLLGGIPAMPADAEDLYAQTNPQSHVAESWRAVRTNLLFSNPDAPPKVLLVTSAGPREGKTTTVANLGLALAQSGARTLVVDTDLRRPRLHQVFDVDGSRGLTQLVVGDGDRDTLIQETGIANLWILPCGAIPPNPSELLGSVSLQETLKTLSAEFDRVILDSPPVIPVTDAAVLSPAVDGAIVVARAGSTPRDLLLAAHRRLTNVNANVIGVVLNAVTSKSGRYSAYPYHYSYYTSDKDSTEPKPKPVT